MRQVITVEPGGIMSGLQVKPGKGLDLTKFGAAEVRRASEIVWDDSAQKWFIQLTGRHQSLIATHMGGEPQVTLAGFIDMVDRTPDDWYLDEKCSGSSGDWLLFGDYDAAVKHEIAFLDSARLKGLIT